MKVFEKSYYVAVVHGKPENKESFKTHFDEFYKDDSSRHDFDSSGLGMPICKRIVEKHGGRIWIKSSKKLKGTTIYYTLPKTSKNSIINHNRKNI